MDTTPTAVNAFQKENGMSLIFQAMIAHMKDTDIVLELLCSL